MQFILFYIFTIIYGYSLVISIPINQNTHEKASAIANDLLKKLANETLANQVSQQIKPDIKDQQDDIIIENFYPIYEESSSEANDILPIYDPELIRYFQEKLNFDENIIPVIYTPIMDDNINH